MNIKKLVYCVLFTSLFLGLSLESIAQNTKTTPKKSESKKEVKKTVKKAVAKKDKADTTKTDSVKVEKKKESAYSKLAKSFAKTVKGGFMTLHKTDGDQIYIEIPVKYSGRRFLAGGEIKQVSDPENMHIGYKYEDPLYLQLTIKDSILLLQKPTDIAFSNDPQMSLAMQRNYIPVTYKRIQVDAYNADSTAVVFKATSIINSLIPKTKEFSPISGDDKSTYFSEMKAFDDNASINITQNVEQARSFLGMKIPIGKGTITSTVSFLLLPNITMRPRPQDSRIGVFSTNPKLDINTAEDGYRATRYATRWRLQPVDTTAWQKGELVEVTKPIVWYIDNSFPQDWVKPIKEGVLAWNAAFEKIGLKNVMQVKDFPTKEEDPQFDPDNLKYSCIRYIPNATANAMGPSWIDPVTGEILNASVLVYNDVIRLVNNWRFILTAQVDQRARTKKMPKDLMEESMIYVISHEIGHTLGMMHNMGASYAISVDSLRSPSFTAKYGTTPSIMDYARFNYVAQPNDKGVKLVPPSLGVYDEYLIDWLYRPVPQAKDMWEEYHIANKLIDKHAGDPYYMYGAQQIKGYTGEYDPRSRTEDLGNDPIKAGNYGMSNLKYILPNLNNWVQDDPDRKYRAELYSQLVMQYNRYISNTMAQIGGIYLTQVKDGTPGEPVAVVSKKRQKQSLKWVIKNLQKSAWLDNADITRRFVLHVPAATQVVVYNARELTSTVPDNVMLSNTYTGKKGYSLKNYYNQLYRLSFASCGLNDQKMALQKALVDVVASGASSLLGGKKLADTQPLDNTPSILKSKEINCYNINCSKCIGEDNPPFQNQIDIAAINTKAGYNLIMLKKIHNWAFWKRLFSCGKNKAHYTYIYTKTKAL